MKRSCDVLVSGSLLFLLSGVVLADDLEGRIETISKESQSLVVQGITFYVTETTDYDDGLRTFDDLHPGQKVEVDFQYREGRHYVTEIELDD